MGGGDHGGLCSAVGVGLGRFTGCCWHPSACKRRLRELAGRAGCSAERDHLIRDRIVLRIVEATRLSGRQLAPDGGAGLAVGASEYPDVAEDVGSVKAAVNNHDVVLAVVTRCVSGAGDRAVVRGRERRPLGRSTGAVGVGEDPDVACRSRACVPPIDDERVGGAVVDGGAAFTRRGWRAAGRELVPTPVFRPSYWRC